MNEMPMSTANAFAGLMANNAFGVQKQKRDLIKVNGYDSAQKYPLEPEERAVMFDADDDVMYIKSADINGVAVTKRFRFYEEPIESSGARYATIDDLNKLKEEILNAQQPVRTNNYNQNGNSQKQRNRNSDSEQ